MKKMRKLIPALAMLLVSAVMMSTASFAWFTMSAAVSAQGMSVKAIADGGLVMSAEKENDDHTHQAPGANDYASFVNFADTSKKWYTNGATAIKPSSVNEGAWYTAEAATQDSQAAKENGYTTLGSLAYDATTGATYYLASKLYFKAVEEGSTNKLNVTKIELAFSGSDTTRNLDKALRVAMKCGTDWYYFAPNQTTGTFNYTGIGADSKVGPIANTELVLGSDFTDVTISSTLTPSTAVEVEVYVYYEGEDPNCKSANAVDIQTITVTAHFACVKITTP